jgi:hypothetical protein
MLWDIVLDLAVFPLWVLLPLIPAILIFKIFPDTTVTAKGPLKGLTFKAGGAFAGYLIIFLTIANPLLNAASEARGNLHYRIWNVSGYIKPFDGKVPSTEQLQGVLVNTNPGLIHAENNFISGNVIEDVAKSGLPRISITVDKYGPRIIDLNEESSEIEKHGRNIKISPVLVKLDPFAVGSVTSVPDKLDTVPAEGRERSKK